MPRSIDRRRFFQTGAAGVAMTAGASAHAAESERIGRKTYREAAKDVPIVDHHDVVVCGAGPAGVAAAIAAARQGAKAQLIEFHGCLGGVWTAGLLSWILDASNKSGIMREIIERLKKRDATQKFGGSVAYDPEPMKILLEEMCLEAGVHCRLHTHIVGAAVEDGRLRLAVTESKSGREAFSGDVFIDATGDGDLAAFAGCGFDVGRPGSAEVQPMSMLILVTGLVPDEVALFTRGLAEPRGERDPKTRLLNEMRKAGVEPSYARPTLFWLRDDLFNMSINHQYNVPADDAEGITQATLLSRSEVHRLVDGLRSLGGIWKNMRIVGTPEYIGVREGRRVHGLYTVTTEDLVNGARFDDAVCRVTFPVDVHSTNPVKQKGIMREGIQSKPYDIPFRSLIAKDVEGLLMAGRCISGDFIAHSSYRVTGDAAPMGEAAGVGAALAAKSGRLAQDVPWKEIAEALDRTP